MPLIGSEPLHTLPPQAKARVIDLPGRLHNQVNCTRSSDRKFAWRRAVDKDSQLAQTSRLRNVGIS